MIKEVKSLKNMLCLFIDKVIYFSGILNFKGWGRLWNC